MAKQTLPVNFEDDILDPSMDGKRRYRLIENADGTYSLEDVTDYTQVGSNFGAAQINATNTGVNNSADIADIIDDLDDIAANVTPGKMAGALAVKQLNDNYIVEEGENDNGHYRKWSNGTLEMWGGYRGTFSIPSGNVQGNIYYSANRTIPFPIESKTSARIVATVYSNGIQWLKISTSNTNKTGFDVVIMQPTGANPTANVNWSAIGTWK